MQPSFLNTPFGEVAFRKYGAGGRLLIAFHGFSADGAIFRAMGGYLDGGCTLYAIDLPFHGNTQWRADDYRPGQLAAVVRLILAQEGKGRFEAIGHSLGARLWLHLLPFFKGQATCLYLLAPDGLQTRWLYLVEWLPVWWRRLFIHFAQRPGWILALARRLHRLGWVDDFLLRYLNHHLGEAQLRYRLLHTWMAIGHFRLGTKKVAHLIRQARVPVYVLLGDEDRLVKPESIRRRLDGLDEVSIEEISATHRSICRAAAPYVKNRKV